MAFSAGYVLPNRRQEVRLSAQPARASGRPLGLGGRLPTLPAVSHFSAFWGGRCGTLAVCCYSLFLKWRRRGEATCSEPSDDLPPAPFHRLQHHPQRLVIGQPMICSHDDQGALGQAAIARKLLARELADREHQIPQVLTRRRVEIGDEFVPSGDGGVG